MMAVNLNGVFYCIDAVLSAMLERASGRIVNIASTAGLTGYPYIVPYCAAKHGVVGLTRALALEVVRSGITVNAICPGFTETDLLSDSAEKVGARTGVGKEEIEEKYRQQVPLGRFVKPQEIASPVLWLAEPEQAAITGQTITIAGGEVV